MLRTTMVSGKAVPIPSIASPVGLEVAKPHAVNLIGVGVTPRATSARDNARACQSILSTTRPTRGRRVAGCTEMASGEGRIEKAKIQFSGVKALAGFDRRHDNHGRAEQHRINRVEIAIDARKQFGERSSIVTRSPAR